MSEEESGVSDEDAVKAFASARKINAPAETTQEEAPSEDPKDEQEPEEKKEEPVEESDELDSEVFARALGLPLEDIIFDEKGIKFRTKIDGTVHDVDFGQLRKSFQLEGHVNKKSMEVSEAKKALEAKEAKALEDLSVQARRMASLNKAYEDQLSLEFSSVNWDDLRKYDAAEYTAKRIDFEDKITRFAEYESATNTEWTALSAAFEQKRAEAIDELLREELEHVMLSTPDLQQEAEFKSVVEYLKQQGMSQEELKRVNRYTFGMARKAMLYDKTSQKKEVIQKKMVKVPKMIKAGGSQTSGSEDHASLMKKYKETGDEKYMVEAFKRAPKLKR